MHIYPIITTPALADCRRFYVKALDAKVLFEQIWYIHLAVGDFEIGFLRPDPPTRLPIFRHAVPSRGLCLAVEVPDVRAVFEQFKSRGFPTMGPPEKFPHGEWAFSITDPSGVVLNVIERQRTSKTGPTLEI